MMAKTKLAGAGVALLLLTGCGGVKTLNEAVPRGEGIVAEDWHTFRGGCDVAVEDLVQDARGVVWVEKLAPACQDVGEAEMYSWGPFNPGIKIPVEEVPNIKKVEAVDTDSYRHFVHIEVEV